MKPIVVSSGDHRVFIGGTNDAGGVYLVKEGVDENRLFFPEDQFLFCLRKETGTPNP